MNRIFFLLFLILAACSGDDDDSTTSISSPPQGVLCDDRQGTYRVHADEMSGDCGEIPDSIEVVGASDESEDCEGKSITSSNNCSIELQIQCDDGNVESTLEGKVVWSVEGDQGSGLVQITVSGPAGFCSSIYLMSWTRI
jgi:hypothetical protein